jgi:PAS domain S-box-containing protein
MAQRLGMFDRVSMYERKDGSPFHARTVTSALYDSRDQQLSGYACLIQPIGSDRESDNVAGNDQTFRLLVASVKDYAIFRLDPGGYIATWNAGAERIKGYRAEEIIGRHFSQFYPREDVAWGKPQMELEVATREGRFEDEGWRVRKDGTVFWANVVITALFDSQGQLVGFGKVTRDLTDRRRLEEERVQRAQAEEAIRLRDEFLSIASHELKTPLTALQLQLDGLRELMQSGDERVARRLERASRSSNRLSDLVEALLDVSRIATGRLELRLQRFDMTEAVRDVVERLREAASRAGCELEVEAPQAVVGTWDRLRVEQVIVNLLSNAIKYAAGKPVAISLSTLGNEAVIQVLDHGPGVPDADLTRIFGRFERAASVRHHAGMGLGLYVTQQIAQAHGGSVSAENVPTGGARFTVRFPLIPPAAPARVPQPT